MPMTIGKQLTVWANMPADEVGNERGTGEPVADSFAFFDRAYDESSRSCQ